MNNSYLTNRRKFIKGSAAAGALSLAPGSIRAANKASNFMRVGVIGLSRGVAHVRRFAETSGVEVAYVCDVDEKRIARGTKALKTGDAKGVTDFRRILEDDEVDVLSIAAPNFWHAPAAILAMEAGKHVYVEKPGSHNMAEADMIVAASRKYDRPSASASANCNGLNYQRKACEELGPPRARSSSLRGAWPACPCQLSPAGFCTRSGRKEPCRSRPRAGVAWPPER